MSVTRERCVPYNTTIVIILCSLANRVQFGLTAPINFIATELYGRTAPAVVEINSDEIRLFTRNLRGRAQSVMPTVKKNRLRVGLRTSGLTSYRMSTLIHRHA